MMTLMFIPIIFTLIISNFSSTTTDDWVEIVNPTEIEINFNDYLITDVAGNKIEKNMFIPAKGNCVFDWSNKLNNGGDTIFLQKKDGTQVDCVKYKDGAKGECANTREPTETKPTQNCTVPTNTPKPTVAPTVFLTQKPEPASPTGGPTVVLTPKPKPEVLSAETVQPTSSSIRTAEPDPESIDIDPRFREDDEEIVQENDDNYFAIFSMGLGSVMIIASGALIYKKEYNKI